ncbi:mutator family transposase [Albidovulum inexpectatum]|uniref:Mutator family transposase n=1 Tax=Albidovulum inexpectatum TaxID=196587 RepID=A0A2S5JLD7_9RHOB|nr:mutator family transposase [Albidovulum inexpectatum]
MTYGQIPCAQEQGISLHEQGIFLANQGSDGRYQGAARQTPNIRSCAAQSSGRGFAVRHSRVSSGGWVPLRIAAWILGERKARYARVRRNDLETPSALAAPESGRPAFSAPAWRRAWQDVIPFFGFDPAIRNIIYTTNAIENLNRVIRKSFKTRGSFPTDEAATKLICLAIRKF